MGRGRILNPKFLASVLGLAASAYLTLESPGVVPALPFTEHYQSLLVSLSLGLLSKGAVPFLAPFLSSLGVPPFLQELSQPHPFDIGTWKIAASLPFTAFLLLLLLHLARREGIENLADLVRALFF